MSKCDTYAGERLDKSLNLIKQNTSGEERGLVCSWEKLSTLFLFFPLGEGLQVSF